MLCAIPEIEGSISVLHVKKASNYPLRINSQSP